MTASIFWYDYETTGTDPRRDRPLQVAGIRTDEQLNEIGEPLNLYCRPSDDILPHPMSCLITGIAPQQLERHGLGEAEFVTRLHAELARPGTCTAGYNSLRFDDEVTRHSLYRNFFDPYAREWQGGNSRWDLIDLVRSAYALRPQGIEWPEEDGRVTLKLERLTAANGIEHGQAHDALADVRATIALARLLRERQPRLYDWCYRLRGKQRVLEQIHLLQPMVHISGRFSAQRHFLAVVLPLAWHPRNRNALIVCDLQADIAPLLELPAEVLAARLYTRHEELADGESPVPLKLVHINRCPVVAPLKVLREEDCRRLGVDMSACLQQAESLQRQQTLWKEKLPEVFAENDFVASEDPEQRLYDGFIGDRDRGLCVQVRESDPERLAERQGLFSDERLEELLFRYRARNFPHSLTTVEQQRWEAFCRLRLSDGRAGAPIILGEFEQVLGELLPTCGPHQQALLAAWQARAEALRRRYALD